MVDDKEALIEKMVREGDLEGLLKEAMRDAGYKTVKMPDGTEVPL